MVEEYFKLVLTIVLAAAFCIFALAWIVDVIVEPAYISIFKKPMYLYFYPVLKKLPDTQRRILENNVPFYRRQTDKRKQYFEHRMANFLMSYRFHPKAGLIVNDEMKVMISASYVMLTFGMRRYKFEVFDKIILYPDVYRSTISNEDHHGEFNPQFKAVVFSWKHFKEGYERDSDNLNLGIHEFAHALHHYGLRSTDNGAAIFADQYDRILKEVKHPANAKRLIDSKYFRIYAYTNQFEFIAVILEHFFETPETFRREFPVLYDHVCLMINYKKDIH
jgi:Mlc titration factor MtfA (ptsG expression regulator)